LGKVEKLTLCKCGCGEYPKSGNVFVHGHNNKDNHKKRAPKKPKQIPILCKCNCGKYASPGKIYLRGHSNQDRAKPKSSPQLCACGKCGLMTKPGRKYINYHNPTWNKGKKGLQTAWNKDLTKETDERVEKYAGITRGKKRPNISGPFNPNFGKVSHLHHSYGKPSWNSGLTKETNENVKKISNSLIGNHSWNNGLSKETDPRLMKMSIDATGKKQPNGAKSKYGELNPAWRGGVTWEEYSREWQGCLKEAIRKRDDYQCQECNLPQTNFKYNLSVHHIDYNKKNCDPENLIALCHSCHSKTNFKREYWQNRFKIKNENKRKMITYEI